MGFKNIGEKSIEKMYNAGIDSIFRILRVREKELITAGFGKGQSKIILASIRYTLAQGMNKSRVLGVSGVLGQGIGKQKTAALLKAFPNILEEQQDMTYEQLTNKVLEVDGFALLSARTVSKKSSMGG